MPDGLLTDKLTMLTMGQGTGRSWPMCSSHTSSHAGGAGLALRWALQPYPWVACAELPISVRCLLCGAAGGRPSAAEDLIMAAHASS